MKRKVIRAGNKNLESFSPFTQVEEQRFRLPHGLYSFMAGDRQPTNASLLLGRLGRAIQKYRRLNNRKQFFIIWSNFYNKKSDNTN